MANANHDTQMDHQRRQFERPNLIDSRERNRQLWRCACEWKTSARHPSWHSTTYCREREREEITFARKTFRLSHLQYYVQKTMIRSLRTSLGWPPHSLVWSASGQGNRLRFYFQDPVRSSDLFTTLRSRSWLEEEEIGQAGAASRSSCVVSMSLENFSQ